MFIAALAQNLLYMQTERQHYRIASEKIGIEFASNVYINKIQKEKKMTYLTLRRPTGNPVQVLQPVLCTPPRNNRRLGTLG